MGKYKLDNKGDYKGTKGYHELHLDYLHSIRNELAEANRLKRLELKQKYANFDASEGSYCIIEKELKDQA